MKRVVVATALLGVSSVSADELTSAREQRLYEVSHSVEVRVVDGVATYKVRRQFANPGLQSDEARLVIDLPSGAAATGLRIRAKDRWYDGLLMERDQAAALYQELTGLGPWEPKDPALLSWLWTDKLRLQIFPVFPKQVSTVEYTLTVPTRYANGRYWLSYPRTAASSTLTTPTLSIKADAQTLLAVDSRRVGADTPVVLAAPAKQAWEDVIAPVDTASYASSVIEVPESSHTTKPIAKLELELGVTHTYLGDVQVELVTPQGKRVMVREQAGGGDNNLGGKQTIALPPGTTGAGTWRLVVSDHIAGDAGSIDSWKLAFGTGADATAASAEDVPVFVPDAPESPGDAGIATISIAPPAIATWTARYGRIAVTPVKTLARLELDVAPQLTPLPVRAQIVFVVDASYSGGEQAIAAQLATIRAYLSHIPDAEVEIIAYRRRATRVFGGFVPAKQLDARLRTVPSAFVLGNGSALDEGARLATTILANRTGQRRVVLMTDQLLRNGLAPAGVLAALDKLAKETVVHVIVPHVDTDDRVRVEREDDHAFAPLATKHHGVYAHLHGVIGGKQLAPAVLELVRPTRIERLTVPAGFTIDGDKSLAEGSGLRLWTKTAVPAQVAISGYLWSDPITKTVTPTVEFTRSAAAFAFGADEHEDFTPTEMMTLALAGRAVSPVTSYVAFEPGTRPSTDGFLDGNIYGGLLGDGFGYGMSGFGAGGGGVGPRPITVPTERCVARHKPEPGWRVDLALETTRDEIVHVEISQGSGAFAACLVEAAWSVRLDGHSVEDHDQFLVSLRD